MITCPSKIPGEIYIQRTKQVRQGHIHMLVSLWDFSNLHSLGWKTKVWPSHGSYTEEHQHFHPFLGIKWGGGVKRFWSRQCFLLFGNRKLEDVAHPPPIPPPPHNPGKEKRQQMRLCIWDQTHLCLRSDFLLHIKQHRSSNTEMVLTTPSSS